MKLYTEWRGDISNWWHQLHLIELLYPPTCAICGASGQNVMDLCRGCYTDLPHSTHPCRGCAMPLPTSVAAGSLCGSCQTTKLPFERCITPLYYDGAVPHLVKGLKFHHNLAYGRLLGLIMAEHLAKIWSDGSNTTRPCCIIPVPLHRSRLRERGFNQAQELAKAVCKRLNIPLDNKSCLRTRVTPQQTGLSQQQRRHNLRGAFTFNRSLPPYVAIVDDVITTAATVSELAIALKQVGVLRVEAWALARTLYK